MANEPLRVALLGCGDIIVRHLHAFAQERKRAVIVACCDVDTDRARKAAEASGFPGCRVEGDYPALIGASDIDAVDICLPHHLHEPAAVAFATSGRHVLCEKPLAPTVSECDSMITAARASGVVLMHLEPQRMSATVAAASAAVREGKIGRLVGLQGTFAYWQRAELNRDWRADPSRSGGGHLMDGGIHWIDVLRHLGGEVEAVQAMTASFRPELGVDSEDLAVLNLLYTGGHCGQLFACHATRGRGASPSVTLFGTDGCLSLDIHGGGPGLVHFPASGAPETLLEENSWHTTYERAIRHFIDVVTGDAVLMATPEDGRENVRVVLAAYESARSGRTVRL